MVSALFETLKNNPNFAMGFLHASTFEYLKPKHASDSARKPKPPHEVVEVPTLLLKNVFALTASGVPDAIAQSTSEKATITVGEIRKLLAQVPKQS